MIFSFEYQQPEKLSITITETFKLVKLQHMILPSEQYATEP